MNRRRWLVGAGCLAGALLGEWRASARQAKEEAGVKTLEHFTAVADLLGRGELYSPAHKWDRPAAEAAVARMHDVDALPRDGVDADWLVFVARLGKLREKAAAAAKDARWYHGVFWSTPQSVLDSRKEAECLKEELPKLRAALAKRYGVAFPACPLPEW